MKKLAILGIIALAYVGKPDINNQKSFSKESVASLYIFRIQIISHSKFFIKYKIKLPAC